MAGVPLERDEAWRRFFDRMPVDEALGRDGIFHVTADELKLHGGREPRLMAKIDTLAERPAALAERGLALFPVRNGHYVLFPDPGPEVLLPLRRRRRPGPARIHRSGVDLAGLRHLAPRPGVQRKPGPGLRPSVGPAAGLLRGGGPAAHPAGPVLLRRTSPSPRPSAARVEVARVQIEVDAGYEGRSSIVLVEAKRGRRDDFHVRQLWYPWLHWAALTRKAVRPVFFAYSNGLSTILTEFAFGAGFGELEPVRSRAYRPGRIAAGRPGPAAPPGGKARGPGACGALSPGQ